jgi:hypothetical protein
MKLSAPFLRITFTSILTFSAIAAETNEWSKTTDGKWEEPFWSLGRLPDSSQSILIHSASQKTLQLDSTTAQQFPDSLTINQLVITGKTTLLLDHLPAADPLRIDPGTNHFDSLVLEKDTALVNLESALIVGNQTAGSLRLVGGRLSQDGGSVQARSALMLNGAEYHLTNGLFEVEYLTVGVGSFIAKSFFNQHSGAAKVGVFDLDAETYRLFAGELLVCTNASLKGGAFIQSGGIHRVPSLSVFQSYNGGGPGSYSLDGGTLAVSNASVGAFLSGSTFRQNGGTFEITNAFTLIGSSRYHPPNQIPATYALTDGTMRAQIVELNSRSGLAEFIQGGGMVSISEQLRLNVPDADTRSYLSIGAGVLHSATISSAGAGADILQTGGEIIVTNGFSFGGYIPPPYWASGDRRVPRYRLQAGRLQATGIEISGEIVIEGSSPRDRISNLGTFKLAGTLTAGHCNESQLGPFVLATNSLIDLGYGHAYLAFANSSSESWQPDSTLTITNWSSPISGRPDDRLSFGTDASGLSPQQLDMIRFVNPAGFPPGEYPARILPSGVIVPQNPPGIAVSTAANKLTLQWDQAFRLQTSTNVTGPYDDLPAINQPYQVDVTQGHQRYFRLQER